MHQDNEQAGITHSASHPLVETILSVGRFHRSVQLDPAAFVDAETLLPSPHRRRGGLVVIECDYCG